ELQAIRKTNPPLNIIIIASPGTRKNKKLMDVFNQFSVRVVEDGSRNLVDSIVKIIDENDARIEETEAFFAELASEEEYVPQTVKPEPQREETPSPTKAPRIKPPVIKLPKIKAPIIPIASAPINQEPEPPTPSNEPIHIAPPLPEPVYTAAPVVPKPAPTKNHKALKLPRPTVPVVIPVFGGGHGAGCTWLAVQIGSYISQQGHSVALCGATDMLLMGPRYVRAGDTQFSVKGIDVYPDMNPSGLIRHGYDYIVFDVGLIMIFERDGTAHDGTTAADMQEVMRAPCKIMVTDIGLWRQSTLTQLFTNRVWQQLAQTSSIAVSCRAAPDAVTVLERQHKTQFVRLPVAEPFEITAEVTQAVELLLKPLFK
ncbi:MAG TPA: hypothetical protein PKB13_06030, partial [Clostridia bacterium]|nr:hypothetical protein [Clostridia bacterium]